jgi:hypothetical protein
LSAAATFLYQDGARYWYSTQPTVTKLAEDRAEQLKRDYDKVTQELDKRLRADLQKKGDFHRIHPLPQTSQDVPDDMDARLVVLGIDHPYSKGAESPAEQEAKKIDKPLPAEQKPELLAKTQQVGRRNVVLEGSLLDRRAHTAPKRSQRTSVPRPPGE